MSAPKIALIHPGHGATTAWVFDGYEKYLTRQGCDLSVCRTDKLVAFSSFVIGNSPITFEGDQGATSEQWRMHLAQQLMLIRIMEQQLGKPDVTIVVCGRLISPQNYLLFDMIPGSKVVLLTESPYEDESQKFIASFYDFAFVNDKISVGPISLYAPTAYMPHGYDPEIFFPRQEEHEFDVSFIGTPFGNRRPVLRDIRYAQDLKPFIFDATVTTEEDGTKTYIFTPPSSAAECYRRSKVNLNIHRTDKYYNNGEHITEAFSLGPRAFEIAGCGAFQLCDNTRPELQEIFGDTIATYDSPEEVVERIRYWVDPARDDLRRDMALASQEIAVKHNTYAHRARRLVDQLAQWYNRPDWVEQEKDEKAM